MSDTPPEAISEDEQQALAHAVKGSELANAALNSLVQHLSQKYAIHQPDQLLANGRIHRAPSAGPARESPPVGTRAVRRREKFGKS